MTKNKDRIKNKKIKKTFASTNASYFQNQMELTELPNSDFSNYSSERIKL